jgi:hypothetical protein
MAKIYGPILPDVVHSTRGVLDYAVCRGIPYVRKWPNKPILPRSPAVQAAGAEFASFSRRVGATDPSIIAGLPNYPSARTWTWKDALTSAAYGKLYK